MFIINHLYISTHYCVTLTCILTKLFLFFHFRIFLMLQLCHHILTKAYYLNTVFRVTDKVAVVKCVVLWWLLLSLWSRNGNKHTGTSNFFRVEKVPQRGSHTMTRRSHSSVPKHWFAVVGPVFCVLRSWTRFAARRDMAWIIQLGENTYHLGWQPVTGTLAKDAKDTATLLRSTFLNMCQLS